MSLEFRDKLGGVIISPELLARAKAFVPPVVAQPSVVIEEPTETGPWECVYTQLGSDQKTIHRVEQRGKEVRCTCMDFRIHKNKNCKHIVKGRADGKVTS